MQMQIARSSRRSWLVVLVASMALLIASPVLASSTVYAQSSGVIVYSSPTPAAPQITTLAAGAAVLSHGAEGEWLNVDVDVDGTSVNGWIHSDEVAANPPS
jgi:uncharacterized protein YraI